MTGVAEVGEGELNRLLSTGVGGVLIDFWSPWCRRCHSLRPQLEALATEHAEGWRFVAVDAEAEPAVADAFGVQSLPTLVFCRSGKEQDRLSGSVLPSVIRERLQAL